MDLLDSSVSDKHTPSYIKNQFEKHQDDLYLLGHELINLARHIKIWLAIEKVQHDTYWGWVQYTTLTNMCLLAIKISNADVYINDFLKKIISNEQKAKLFKLTMFNQRVKTIKKIVEPLKEYRNKRYAHLECTEVEVKKCNIKDLYIALSNLHNTLMCIHHSLSNPVIEFITRRYDLRDVTLNTCQLEKHFEEDRVYIEFLNMQNAYK